MGINLIKKRSYPVTSLFPGGFQTPHLAVSGFKAEDALEMEDGFDSSSIWRFSRGIDSASAAGDWLVATLEDSTRAAFAVRLRATAELAGFCVLSSQGETRVEVGGWFAPRFWNQGMGRELLEALAQRTTDARGCCPLVAEVDPDNKAACCLLARTGFVADGGLWVVG